MYASAIAISLAGCHSAVDSVSYLDGPEDLHGKILCTQIGAAQDFYLSDNFSDSEIRYVEQMIDVPLMVRSGKADAGVTSSLMWMFQEPQYPEMSCFELGACNSEIGFPLRKENTALASELNAFLDRFIGSDEHKELMDGWRENPDSRPMPVLDPEVCNLGVLTVASSPDQPPFGMLRNGEIAGIEPEILTRFAMEKRFLIQFVSVSFNGIIPAINSGRADMGCACMSITPERSRSVLFSNPWIHEETVVVVHSMRMSQHSNSTVLTDNAAGSSRQSLWKRVKGSFIRNVIIEGRYRLLWQGTLMTILISLLSALFGTLAGILLSMQSASRFKLFRTASSLYIRFMRCMPEVVLLMVMYYVVLAKTDLSGPAVAVVAFSMCFGAYSSVIFTSVLDNIDKGQREAALALGFTPLHAFVTFILPQVIQRALPVYKNEFISLVKATSIVGYITVFDLTRAGDMIRSRTFEAFFPLLIVTVIYFLIIWLMTSLLKLAEFKAQPIVHKYSKR